MKTIAVSALVLGLGVITSCRRQPSPTVFLDPALAVLVPPDTTMLAGIRMQRIRATPFSEELKNSPRLSEFQSSMGLVGESDIWEILIASNDSQWVALLRGKFTEMGMEPRIEKPSARRENFNGIPIVGDEKGAVAFLNPTTAIAGSFDAVLQTVERRNANSGVPESLRKLTDEIPSTNYAWFTSVGPVPSFLPVSKIKTARAGFDPQTRILDLMVEAESAGAAKSTGDTIGGSVEGTRVTFQGPARANLIDWMLGRSSRAPATR